MAIALFDCDGILVNTEEITTRNARQCLQALGLTYSDDEFQERFDGADFATFRQCASDDYFQRSGQPLPEKFFEDMQASYLVLEAAEIKPIAGVQDLLESLERSQVPMAVCSNSFAVNIERKLKMVGLFNFFAGRIIGRDHVVNGKPAPDVYLAGMARLGGTDPQKSIAFEDSTTGVKAARAAQMHVMGYTGGNAVPAHHAQRLVSAGADFTAASMAAIAMEAFERIDMIDQGPGWRNAPQRAKRLGHSGPV